MTGEGPRVPVDAPHGLPGLIRQRYERDRDRVACADDQRTLTYHELELASDAMAEHLTALRLPPGPVALRIRRGVELTVAMLGILKAGHHYLPIGLDEPDQRVGAMRTQARPVAVIAGPGLEGAALGGLPAVSTVDTLDAGRWGSGLRPLPPVAPDTPAYIMFTSGSTGTPKGAIVGSAALCNRLLWMQRRYQLGDDDRVLQKTPYTFDVSGWELFWPLIAGARCQLPPEKSHRDPVEVARLIAAHRITVCHFVPTMLAELLQVADPGALATLRYLFTSGEALSPALARRAVRLLPAQLHNLYGPTEAAIDVTAWQVPRTIGERDQILIGTPIDNTRLYVVDADGRQAEPGAAGELWIGGTPVAEGYAGAPELTAAAFPVRDGQRCYRTGDLVRWRPGGLEFLGRLDDQVKVGGVRVEPLEIEQALARVAGVDQVAVVPVRDEVGAAALVAVLAGDGTQNGPAGSRPGWLRERLAGLLPPAMVPAHFQWVDGLPLTSSGKADRQRIRRMAQRWWDERSRTGDGDAVAAAWLAATGAADTSDDVGFLRAGGGSLSAIRMVARLRAALAVELPLRLLLDDATLAQVRAHLATAPRVAPDRPVVAAGQPDGEDLRRSPLAPEQRRLWLTSRLHPDSAGYNVVSVLRFAGDVDRAALATALDAMVARHDILRARVIEESPGEPMLHYAGAARLDFTIDTTAERLSDRVVEAFAARVAGSVIDDGRAPMALARLLRCADAAQSCLVLVFNHLVADQRSVDIMLGDLAAGYNAARSGRASPMAGSGGYAAYAHRAAARVGGSKWRADVDHWRRRLDAAPPELRMPFAAGDGAAGDAGVSTFEEDDEAGALRTRLATAGTTPANFFLAVFATVLSRWSGQGSVVIGMPASRRRTEDEDEVVGFLVDTLPIRLDVGEVSTFAELLAHARGRYLEALSHAEPCFDQLVAELGVPYRPHRNPVFQVWLNDLTGGGTAPEFDGLRAEALLPPTPGALFDLGLYLHRRGDRLALRLVRAAGRYDQATADELLSECVTVARQALAHPDVRLADLDLVTRRASELLVAAATEPPPVGPRVAVVDDIAAVVASGPDRVAVVSDDRTMTYRQLWDAVDREARRLGELGVAAGDRIGLVSAGAAGLPVALLAAWRVGAVAGLLDAAWPAGHLAGCRAVLGACATVRVEGADLDITPVDRSARAAGPAAGTGDDSVDRPTGPLSHVLFTSGSTGVPVPVAVPHGPLRDFLRWYIPRFGVTGADRFAALSGAAHDPILRDVLAPLLVGGRLHIPPPAVRANPALSGAWLSAQGITVLHVTPGLLELVLADPAPALDRLRLVVVGGAPLSRRVATALRARSAATIVHAYGTTETPQIVAYHEVSDADLAPGRPDAVVLPIGTGAPGHVVTVLSAGGRPAAIGERGEIVVRSHNLAAGYLGGGRRGFTRDPATGAPTFHTGDLGRLDPAGRIHLDGRADRQVSLGGHRLELADVERAALRHPDVLNALAGLIDSPLGPVLALQVQPGAGRRLDPEALRAHLGALLPRHAVPVVTQIVEGFTLGANQKIELLPYPSAPAEVRAGDPPGILAPSFGDDCPAAADTTVDWIAARLRDLLGRPVRPDENFFDAGLTSVTLLQLHRVVVQRLGRPFPVTAMFAYPNLGALADHLAGTGAGGSASERQRPNDDEVVTAADLRREARRRIEAELARQRTG